MPLPEPATNEPSDSLKQALGNWQATTDAVQEESKRIAAEREAQRQREADKR